MIDLNVSLLAYDDVYGDNVSPLAIRDRNGALITARNGEAILARAI